MPTFTSPVTVTVENASDVAFSGSQHGKTTWQILGDGTLVVPGGVQASSTSVSYNGDVTARAATTAVKIGSHTQGYGVKIGSVVDVICTGTPEGAITAPVGSTARRTDGGANTTLYRKESGAGNTGWVAVSAAAGGTLTWVALPLTADYTDAHGAYGAAPCEYAVSDSGLTYVKGEVIGSSALPAGGLIGTLPLGARPIGGYHDFSVEAGGALARVRIDTDGTIVQADGNASVYLSLSSIPPFRVL